MASLVVLTRCCLGPSAVSFIESLLGIYYLPSTRTTNKQQMLMFIALSRGLCPQSRWGTTLPLPVKATGSRWHRGSALPPWTCPRAAVDPGLFLGVAWVAAILRGLQAGRESKASGASLTCFVRLQRQSPSRSFCQVCMEAALSTRQTQDHGTLRAALGSAPAPCTERTLGKWKPSDLKQTAGGRDVLRAWRGPGQCCPETAHWAPDPHSTQPTCSPISSFCSPVGDRQLDLQWGQEKPSLGVATMDSVISLESRFWGGNRGQGQSDLPKRGHTTLGPLPQLPQPYPNLIRTLPQSVTPTYQGPLSHAAP